MGKWKNNIIAIGSHFDDIEIGCAGTLLKHSEQGDHIKFYILNSDEHLTGNPNDRFKEQEKSINFIHKLSGIKNITYETFAEADDDKTIIQAIDFDNPEILFVPWEHDTHQDHRRASIIGQAVGRKRHIETFFYSSGSAYNFHPTIFNMIDFDKKKEILECHKSQVRCGAVNIDIIEKREAYWGSLMSLSVKHAEGFIARKMRYPYGN